MEKQKVNLKSFKQKVNRNKPAMLRFIRKVDKTPPKNLDKICVELDKSVWEEMDCLSCANCCKTMSPTYNAADIKRISAHLGMTQKEFKEKWLYIEPKDNDWMNVSTPCQFLDLSTNMCSIYEVRPVDCAGFPHLAKKRMKDYIHIHKQNIEYCPATYRMVEKMMAHMEA